MTTNQTIDGVSLMPCPFCGGEADTKCTQGDYPDWYAECLECGASADIEGPYSAHHWNRRADQPEQPKAEPVAVLYASGAVLTRADCVDDDVFAICCKVETPLYAHPYSGEVERLHIELKELRESMAYRTSLFGKLERECDNLRAQLAERDKMLRGAVSLFRTSDLPMTANYFERKLSTSAEPKPRGEAVAVELPERKNGNGPSLSNHRSYNQGWNACLDEVTRLNTR